MLNNARRRKIGDYTPLVYYKCKHCKRIFDMLIDAESCEISHVQIKGTKIIEYGIACPYPIFIDIEFTDGSQVRYVLEREAWQK